ncbi:MAG: ureidoglycolate lyase [Pseudomonadota bacterium]
MSDTVTLNAVPLTEAAFERYGEVIDLRQAQTQSINGGLTCRYHDLVTVDTADGGGCTLVNVFRTAPIPLPHKVVVMERHPLGSQAFLPMDQAPFLVLVGEPEKNALKAIDLTLFITDGHQGVNFNKNCWHHYQLVLGKTRDFVVIDRGGDGQNLEECVISDSVVIPDIDSRTEQVA